jgi:hypothetical protein
MSGSKGSRRLTKFWWVLSAMFGAGVGATAATTQGLSSAIWAIVGVGFPILVVVGILEWTASEARPGRPRPWRNLRRPVGQPQRTRGNNKLVPKRPQLHAINGRKTVEPPSSGKA